MKRMGGTDIYFSGVPQPVRLVRSQPLLEIMGEIFPSWPFRVEASAVRAAPVITIHRTKREYRIDAPWLEESIFTDTRVGALSSLVVDLIYAWLEAGCDALCLHCAAVEFAGRLVVFPNTNKVGKSLLAARLMAENHTCYGDDLMALTLAGEGMSFGIPPRLRLPLPASEKVVAEFMQAYGGQSDSWNRYVAPDAPCLAPFGQTRPIEALVMLARQEGINPELVPADFSGSLRNLVYQNFMRRGSAPQVLDLAASLAAEKPCWHLRYACLDDAVALLRNAFSETGQGFCGSRRERRSFGAPETVTPHPFRLRSLRRPASDKNFIRCSDVLIRQEQAESFLLSGDEIFYLNPLGRAVWELLAEPFSEAGAVQLIASVFPETPPAQIERDVVNLFAAFKKRELILKV